MPKVVVRLRRAMSECASLLRPKKTRIGASGLIEEIVVKHPDRAEADRFYNYPFEAMEEALVNAVYHRSYEIREPIEVRILHSKFDVGCS